MAVTQDYLYTNTVYYDISWTLQEVTYKWLAITSMPISQKKKKAYYMSEAKNWKGGKGGTFHFLAISNNSEHWYQKL